MFVLSCPGGAAPPEPPSHLGHDEAVVVEVAWVVVAILHGVEEQHRHDLCHAAA